MQLIRFSYSDYAWVLNDLNLQLVNLIVGKNASGKSKTLSNIDLLVNIISQKKGIIGRGSWKVQFRTRGGEILDYSVATKSSGQITREVLVVDGKHLLNRKGRECQVFSNITNDFEEFFPPENQLVLHVRRDVKAFPYFERLIGWAANSYGFRLGTISPLNALANSGYDFMNPVEDLVDMFRQLTDSHKDDILKSLGLMGYDITAIRVGATTQPYTRLLEVTENGISKRIPHIELSQGMFRIVALLVYLTYLIRIKKPQLITIDDLGEGLDYQRVVRLGKFVFDACEQEQIQLIATSNDGLLMDSIPIKYWNVLTREGTEIKALNEHNNPKLFEDFPFTGLSNFDFFSSDYLASYGV